MVLLKIVEEFTVAGTVPDLNRIPFYAKDECLSASPKLDTNVILLVKVLCINVKKYQIIYKFNEMLLYFCFHQKRS